ncbi:hemolysin activator protein [Yersinia frederiksenii]|nr:hemolysin activator protein [Yersinia frederiksenii]
MIPKRTALWFLLSTGAHATQVPGIDIPSPINESRQNLQNSSNEINQLLARELTQIYLSKGYITARIQFIPPKTDDELGLDVTEGFIEKIESDDPQLAVESIFPNMTGKPLNITQLDQGLDQANRLPSNKITIDILPGPQPGGSILKLSNIRSKPWHLTTSLDNYGNKSTESWLSRNSFSFDNPLGLSDSLI